MGARVSLEDAAEPCTRDIQRATDEIGIGPHGATWRRTARHRAHGLTTCPLWQRDALLQAIDETPCPDDGDDDDPLVVPRDDTDGADDVPVVEAVRVDDEVHWRVCLVLDRTPTAPTVRVDTDTTTVLRSLYGFVGRCLLASTTAANEHNDECHGLRARVLAVGPWKGHGTGCVVVHTVEPSAVVHANVYVAVAL